MISTLTKLTTIQFLSLCMAGLLTLGLSFANLQDFGSITTSSQTLSQTVMTELVGANAGGCGILVGAVVMMTAVAVGGVSFGLGALLVMSTVAHAGAVLCLA